jgi:uncharacterized membrane protein
MSKLATYARLQFAIALIAFGVQHIIRQRFTIGESSSWPALIPGGIVWAYLSGVFVILTGTMVMLNKNASPFLMVTGLMIFVWAFVRDLPAFFMHPAYDASLTRLGEALAMTGSVFIVANELANQKKSLIYKLMPLGPVFLGVFLFICGTQHFTLAKYVKTLVPSWIPGNLYWTYFAGAALIAGGIGLMWAKSRRLAAFWSGLMIFIWMLIIHAPRVIHSINDADEWNSLLQTIALSAALFVLAFSKRNQVIN